MDIQLHEDEELERLKEWVKNYGVALVVGAVIGLGGLFGYRYWTHYQQHRAAAASVMYDEVVYNIHQHKPDTATKLGGEVMQKYASTPYGPLTALLLAKMSYDAGDLASAERQLRWAVEHAHVQAVKHTARLRLARVLIAKGNSEAALKLVQGVHDMGGFASAYDELLGDIYRKQGHLGQARTAYTKALSEDGGGSYSQVLEMKLADLGPAPAPVLATTPSKETP